MRKTPVDSTISDLQLEKELQRTIRKKRRWIAFKGAVLILLAISAVCVIAAGLWFPLYRVIGDSMWPYLEQGQVVVVYRTKQLEHGDITVFYHGNQILIKRVIGVSGDFVSIDPQGKVSVNGESLAEEYITKPVLGSSDITYPYQVPENCYFVMGDHRAVSIDSRMSAVGCVNKEMIAGKVLLRIWPIQKLKSIDWGEWD